VFGRKRVGHEAGETCKCERWKEVFVFKLDLAEEECCCREP